MADSFQEKTEQPTEKKLSDARKKGQTAQSKEIPVCFIILFSAIFLYFTVSHGFNQIFRIYASYVQNMNVDITTSNIQEILSFGALRWLIIVGPFFLLLVVITLFSGLLQTGFLWSPEALSLKLEKLNPVTGMKKFFSKRSLVEILKSLVKIVLLTYIAYTLIVRELPRILSLPGDDIRSTMVYLGETAFTLALKIGIFFLFLAGFDFLYQKWQFKKDMMMTQQEVKEEFKEREGNPLVKSRIRSLQREISRRRMMESVKTADVIVTNPTEYAVALKYVAGEMSAPQVVAKGAGFIAEKIKKLARTSGVPVVENKPLARALFFAVNVNEYIPEKFYVIVAELLAQIYKRKGKVRP